MSKIYKFNTYKQQQTAVKEFDFTNSGCDNIIFANSENNKINYTSELESNREYIINGDGVYDPDFSAINYNEYNILPPNVDKVLVKNKKLDKIIKNIYIQKSSTEQPLYKVGLISDIHYNDTDSTDTNPDTYKDDGSEYSADLKNALLFFENHGVDFVSCAGDISTDWSDHLKNFKYCINKYFPNISVFTCAGNHDTKPKFKYHDLWLEVMAINTNNEYEIHRFKDNEEYSKKLDDETYDNFATEEEGTSFYFKKYWGTEENEFDVYIYLNVEYGHNDRNNYAVHNPRKLTQNELLIHNDVQNDDYHMYNPKTLQYFASLLEEFKNNRCFIFTHLMFEDKAGTYHRTNNLNNIAYYDYYNTHIDVLKGDQGEYLKNLLESYDNNYWFCGHSHYKWGWQKHDKYINITKTNNSYNIHLPSLARPLTIGSYDYSPAIQDSEGAIMNVYRDYVEIQGYVFKEGDNFNYDDITSYDGPMEYLTINNLSSSNADIEYFDLEDNIIQINIPGVTTNINVALNDNNSSNYKKHIPVVRFEHIQIFDENDNDITSEIINEHKIGIYDSITDPLEINYYFLNNHIYTLFSNGLILKVSEDSKFVGQSIIILMKMKYAFINASYFNKLHPIACYKI